MCLNLLINIVPATPPDSSWCIIQQNMHRHLHTVSRNWFFRSQNHTESQNIRGWKSHLVQTPAKAGSPTAGCTGPCPGGSWISPEKETPQPPWAAWSRAPSPSEWRSSFSRSEGTSYASVCARCPLSCRWAPLKRVSPHPPDIHPRDIYKHLRKWWHRTVFCIKQDISDNFSTQFKMTNRNRLR